MILIVESARAGLWSYEPSTTFLVYLYLLFSFFLLSLEIVHIFHSTISMNQRSQENNYMEQHQPLEQSMSGATLHLAFMLDQQERSSYHNQNGHYIEPANEQPSQEHQSSHLENTRVTSLNDGCSIMYDSKHSVSSNNDECIYSLKDGNHDIVQPGRGNARNRANINSHRPEGNNRKEIQHSDDNTTQQKTYLYIEGLCGSCSNNRLKANHIFSQHDSMATWNSHR